MSDRSSFFPQNKKKKPYSSQTYTITAALPYANGPIHVGHVAGAYLPADIYARYQRMKGHEVAFICGSDEGGVAILLQAHQQDISPTTLIDTYHTKNKQALAKLGISFDIFDRTSNPFHHRVAATFFTTLYRKGKLIRKSSRQFYDPVEKLFLADRYLQGTCPHCSFEEAYGDQCEACGSSLNPDELLKPRSKLSGTTPIYKETTHWYLPLDSYQNWLEKWILKEHPEWKPNVYGQCAAWLKQGLQPRAITRDLDWGVPVPLQEAKGKVLYVWFEAPIGYISATQLWAQKVGKDWRCFWQDSRTQLVHFVGKDNIVFHCLIFPSMLKAHGDYILPTFVAANEFMNLAGKKLSTSRQHAIWVEDYLQQYPGKEDVLRYVLCINAPETKDSNFSWEDFKQRNNQELVGILGNFVHRVLLLLDKYCDCCVPSPGPYLPIDKKTMAVVQALPNQVSQAIESFKFKKGLGHVMELARVGNKYLADTTPWHTIKKDPVRAQTILYLSVQIIAYLARFSAPYLPFTSQQLMQILQLSPLPWQENPPFEQLQVGHNLGKIHMIFEKIM